MALTRDRRLRGSEVAGRSITVARTILLTGSTGALGAAATRRLLDDGHRVAATWYDESEAKKPAGFADRALLPVQADVTSPASIQTAVDQARSLLGPIDGLVHLVGAWMGGSPTEQHSLNDWNRMLEINLTSAFLCCRAVLPEMRRRDRGRIVLVSSRVAQVGRWGQAAYAASKAGVEILAQTIAEETRSHDVTANVVAPSTMDTPANRRALPDSDPRTWVTVDEVASSIAFLVSDAAGALRGARLPVYGGV
jgi:NAD(P)-dependent dehydrogenase (short-subunit alcohol dehydrogenase family)